MGDALFYGARDTLHRWFRQPAAASGALRWRLEWSIEERRTPEGRYMETAVGHEQV
jgi:hypothetical protein